MSLRNYANTASTGSISTPLNNTDTTSSPTLAASLTGWPSTPCIASINYGLADEEVVLVTAISGPSITLTRGYDGSAKRAHTAGATLTHTQASIDLREPNTHINASSGVHGLSGALVGLTDTQTLTNKTLTAPVVADFTNANHTHAGANSGGVVPLANIGGLTTALLTKADDVNAVHNTGTETVVGAKTFSAPAAFGSTVSVAGAATTTGIANTGTLSTSGLLTASAGAAVGTGAGNTVPLLVDASGTVQPNIVQHHGTVAYSLTSQASVSVGYSLAGIAFTTIKSVQLTTSQGSLFRIDANLNSFSTSSLSIFVRESENAAVTISGTVHITVTGTV